MVALTLRNVEEIIGEITQRESEVGERMSLGPGATFISKWVKKFRGFSGPPETYVAFCAS